MKQKNLKSRFNIYALAIFACVFSIFTATNAAAQEYNARNEFSLTQGGTTGVWNYGYTANDASNTFVPYALTNTNPECGSPAERWNLSNSGDPTPEIIRFLSPATCIGAPTDSLYVHPGQSGQRTVLRFVAPAAGTYQINGVLQRANPNATTDIRILKNETTSLFTGNINTTYQQAFNLTVTVAANDTIDFSVGWGNGSFNNDGSALNVVVSQPPTACLTAPANLQVNVPAENSPSDVQSVNTNAQLVGDAGYTNTGKVSRAFSFDGNGDYVRIEDNAAQKPVNQLTLEGWFKLNNPSGVQFLASKSLRGANTRSYTLWHNGGLIQIEYRSTSGSVLYNTGISMPVNTWTHYALVINTDNAGATANTMKLYANGVEIYSNAANDPIFYDGINNANVPLPLLIGGGFDTSNNPTFFFNGQADEVSIYGRALSQSEIFDIVQQGSFGKCPPAACVQSPNNLVSWFAGEQNALDSRSNNHGTLQNGATFASGRVGQAFSFDGVNDKVAVPNSPSLNITGNQMTIEAWINPTAVAGDRQIVSMASSTSFPAGRKFGLFIQNGFLGFEVNTNNGYTGSAPSTGAITPGVLTHVALVYNGSQVIKYINGVAAGTPVTLTGNISSSTGDFAIGQFAVAGASSFQGLIDEVGIYNRALSVSEIQSIVNAGQSGKCKPSPLNPTVNQVAWFTADGDARDFTGLNPNGILHGDANYKVGKVGQAFNFDGNGDYVEVADDADHKPTNQLTLEGWFKPNNLNGVQFLASKPFSGNGTIRSYALWNGPTMHIEYRSTGGSVLYNTGITPQSNIWTHYAMVINTDDTGATANTIKLYLNGAEVYTNTANDPIVYGAAIPFYIGAGADNLNNPTFFFNGQADEVSLYSRALSVSEVGAIYNAGTAGKLKSVVTPVNFADGERMRQRDGERENTASSEIAQSQRLSFSASQFAPTTVQLADASVTFQQVTTAGTTSQSNVDLGLLPRLPASLTFTGLAYDISTTAVYQNGTADDVRVCFNLPSLTGITVTNLRVLHLENGAWINRTATGNSHANFCTDDLTSLSPFVIAEALAPLASTVQVGGRIQSADGTGIRNAVVTLTNNQGNTRTTRTGAFGYYRFDEVEAGQTYVVGVNSKRFQFNSQIISVTEDLTEVNFTAFAP